MRRGTVARLAAALLAPVATLAGATSAVASTAVAPAPAVAPVRSAQWHLEAVNAPRAHQVSQGDGVVVAVIDTGVDARHPDLAGALLPGTAMPGSDSDTRAWTDRDGHGTGMAGLIAARGGGPERFLGVAPRARILPIAYGNKQRPQVAAAIRYAVDHGAKVINLSIVTGRDRPTAEEQSALAYAQSRDVVVVAGAGNVSVSAILGWPANAPGVVTVAGTTQAGFGWIGGVQGREVALSAPAENVIMPGPIDLRPDGIGAGDGTSNSTAIVSGVAALVRARYPELRAPDVVNRLIRTAVDKGAPGRDEIYGYGLVDAAAAVTANVPPATANPLGAVAAPSATAAADPDGGPGTPLTRLLVVAAVGLLGLVVLVLIVRWLVRRASRVGPAPPGYRPQAGPVASGRHGSGGPPGQQEP
jgi:type VII secretion-associated serine protease mycosin